MKETLNKAKVEAPSNSNQPWLYRDIKRNTPGNTDWDLFYGTKDPKAIYSFKVKFSDFNRAVMNAAADFIIGENREVFDKINISITPGEIEKGIFFTKKIPAMKIKCWIKEFGKILNSPTNIVEIYDIKQSSSDSLSLSEIKYAIEHADYLFNLYGYFKIQTEQSAKIVLKHENSVQVKITLLDNKKHLLTIEKIE